MARRAKGTGSLRLRGRVWWFSYFVRGRRVEESSGSEDAKEAARQLAIKIGEVAAGRDVPPEKATVADLCDLVVADYKFHKLRDAATVKWRYMAHIKPHVGGLLASRFGPSQVRTYVSQRRDEGASDATINRELSIVRRGFRLGFQESPPLVRQLPYILDLDEDNARQGFIEQDQYERLLTELPDRLKALFVCAYHVGTRKGELRKVRWNQVDLDAGIIRLERAQTKSKQARTLPIYGDMGRWLEKQKETAPANCQWVFHYRGGLVGSHLAGWREACVRAQLPDLLFHDLRRSAVRNMKRAGISDKEAMDITGHKTRTMFDRYNIVDESDIAAAGEKLQQYVERRKREQAAKLKRVK